MPSSRDRPYNEFITPPSSRRHSENSQSGEAGDSHSSRRRAELSSETEAYSSGSTHIFTPLNLRPARSGYVDRGYLSSGSTWRRDAENREYDEQRHIRSSHSHHAVSSRHRSRRPRSPGIVRSLFGRRSRYSQTEPPSVVPPSPRSLQNAANIAHPRYNTTQNYAVAQDHHYPYGFSPDMGQYPLSNIPAHVYILQPQQAGSAGVAVSPMQPPASHTFSIKVQSSPVQPETTCLPDFSFSQQYPFTDQPSIASPLVPSSLRDNNYPVQSHMPKASAGQDDSGADTIFKIVASKHICDGCGRVRSHRFHDANPIRPGRKPVTNFCRKCRDTFRREATRRLQTDATVDKSSFSLRFSDQTGQDDGTDTADAKVLFTENANEDNCVPESTVVASATNFKKDSVIFPKATEKANSSAGEAAPQPQQTGTDPSPICPIKSDRECKLSTVESISGAAGCSMGKDAAETSIDKTTDGVDAPSRQNTKVCKTREDNDCCIKCNTTSNNNWAAYGGEEAKHEIPLMACACTLARPQIRSCVNCSVPCCVPDSPYCCHRRRHCSHAGAVPLSSILHFCCPLGGKQEAGDYAQENCAVNMQNGQSAGLSPTSDKKQPFSDDESGVLREDFQHTGKIGHDASQHEEANNDKCQENLSTGNKEQAIPEREGDFNPAGFSLDTIESEIRSFNHYAPGGHDEEERRSNVELEKWSNVETDIPDLSRFKKPNQAAIGMDGVHATRPAPSPFEEYFTEQMHKVPGATPMNEDMPSYRHGFYTVEPPQHTEAIIFGRERREQHGYSKFRVPSDWEMGRYAEFSFHVFSEVSQNFTFTAGRVSRGNEENRHCDEMFKTDNDHKITRNTTFHHNLNGFSFPRETVSPFEVEECGEGEDETESIIGARRVKDCEVLSTCGDCFADGQMHAY